MKKYIISFLFLLGSTSAFAITADIEGYEGQTLINISEETGVPLNINLNFSGTEGENISQIRTYGSGFSSTTTCERDFTSGLGLTCTDSLSITGTTSGTKRIRLNTSSGTITINLVIDRTASTTYVDEANIDSSTTFSEDPAVFSTITGGNERLYKNVYLKNNSVNPLPPISGLSLTESDSPFKIPSNSCNGVSLKTGQQCRITLSFSSYSHYDNSYSDTVQVSFGTALKSLEVSGDITGHPIPPKSNLEVNIAKSLDATACLNDPLVTEKSTCYYEASDSTGGQGETSAVSCNADTSECFVQTSFKVSNDPVEFDILIRFNDQAANQAAQVETANLDFSLTPEAHSFGSLTVGQTFQHTLTLTNTGTGPLTLPIVVSLKKSEGANTQITDNCSSLTSPLGVGETCTAVLDGTVLASSSVNVEAEAITVAGKEVAVASGTILAKKTLTLVKTGSGEGSISDDSGVVCDETCDSVVLSYDQGSVVNLTITIPAQQEFIGWGLDCSSEGTNLICPLDLTADKVVTANIDKIVQRPTIEKTLCNTSVETGGTYSCGLSATDPLGTPTFVFGANHTCGAWLTINGSTLEGTPTLGDVGTCTVSIRAKNTDGKSVNSFDFKVRAFEKQYTVVNSVSQGFSYFRDIELFPKKFQCRQPTPGGGIPGPTECVNSGGIADGTDCLIPEGVLFDGNVMSEFICTALYGESNAVLESVDGPGQLIMSAKVGGLDILWRYDTERPFDDITSGGGTMCNDSSTPSNPCKLFSDANYDSIVIHAYVDGKVFFKARNNSISTNQLWVTDGSVAGTQYLTRADTNAQPYDTFNGKFYFLGNDGTAGAEPWVSDGTPGGTYQIADMNPGTANSNASFGYTGYGVSNEAMGKLFFTAYTPAEGSEVWTIDTNGTLALLKDFFPGTSSSGAARLVNFGNNVLFTANDGTTSGLWISDGTEVGTIKLKDLYFGGSGGSAKRIIVNGSVAYISATEASTPIGIELWKTDGTALGTTLVKDINTEENSWNDIETFGKIGNNVFFMADDGTYNGNAVSTGWEIWKTDGTDAGTTILQDIYPGSVGGVGSEANTYGQFQSTDAYAYFVADDGVFGAELWRTNGITAELVIDKDPTRAFLGECSVQGAFGGQFECEAFFGGTWIVSEDPVGVDGSSNNSILYQLKKIGNKAYMILNDNKLYEMPE